MSITSTDPHDLRDQAEYLRRFWARLFADGILKARLATGRSIEETARLAGMELSEWMALEAGDLLPQTEEQLRAIAGALEMSHDRLANFVLLCWGAWEPSGAWEP